MFSCTFIGHSECGSDIVDKLYKTIKDLIVNKNVHTFYVGTHGSFDYHVYKVLCELEKTYDIKVHVVLAYLNKRSEHTYYSEEKTIFPSVLERTPLRYAINKRNIYMISKSQFLICFLNQTFTNTYTFVEKAIKNDLTVINIGKYDLGVI